MKTFKQFIAAALILVTTSLAAVAGEESGHGISFYTILDGASGYTQAAINHLMQDGRGYLWVGTLDGLIRYDGVNSRLFRKEDLRTASSAISCIYEDRKGNIWAGTESGLTRYDLEKGCFVALEATAPNGVRVDSKVNCLTEDPDGLLWFSLKGKGVCSYDPESGALQNYLFDPSSDVVPPKIQKMIIAPGGDFIVATYFGGLWRCSADFRVMEQLSFSGGASFEGDNVSDLMVSPSGTLYAASVRNGLCELSLPALKARRLKSDFDGASLYSITPFGTRILLATNRGLYIYDTQTGTCQRQAISNTPGLKDDCFYCVTTTKDGDILLGGTYGTVYYSSTGGQMISKYDRLSGGESLYYAGLQDFTQDENGNIWISTHKKGILHYDCVTGHISRYRLPVDLTESYGICYGDGNLWIGTVGQLLRYDTLSGRIYRYEAEDIGAASISDRAIFPIVRTPEGNILLCHALGIVEYDPASDSFTPLPGLEEYNVNSVSFGADKTMWLTTYAHGLIKYDLSEKKVLPFQQESLSWLEANKRLSYVFTDSRGRVWVASWDNGCMALMPDGNTRLFTTGNTSYALPSDKVCCMQEDWLGTIWISTENGLASISPDLSTILHYSESDGLLSNHFTKRSLLSGHDGTMYFGSRDGFIAFSGKDIAKDEQTPPELIIDEIVINNKPGYSGSLSSVSVDAADKIVLRHNENTVAVTFSRPHLPSGSDGYILCKLEGADSEWHRSDRENTVVWRFLPGGKYKLFVKSYNAAGSLEHQHKPLTIMVRNTALGSVVAKIIYILLAIALAIIAALKLYHFFVGRAVERQRQMMESQIAMTPERKLLRAAQIGMPVYSVLVPDVKEKDAKLLNKIDAIIEKNISDDALTYSFIAEQMFVGGQSLNLKFKGITGVTLNDYIRLSRLCASVRLLSDEDLYINEVCYRCGFNTPSYYAKSFKNAFGMLPAEYREQNINQ